MTGYRKMISCRIPKIWDMTIRWRKCRMRWIEAVYNRNLKKFNIDVMHSRSYNKREKAKVVERILNPKITKFRDTIDLHTLLMYSHPEYDFWNNICTWCDYFSKNTVYWENYINLHEHDSNEELIAGLSERFHINKDLSTFIVNYLTTWK